LFLPDGRLMDQEVKAFEGILPVLPLRPESLGRNYQDPVRGQPFSGNLLKAVFDKIRQGYGIFHVKTELDGSGDLVDILTSRPGGMGIMEFYFFIVNVQRRRVH
jgi:hypothetical protein